MEKPLNIPTVTEKLRKLYLAGQITLKHVARLYARCGFDNYVNYTASYKRLQLTPQEVSTLTPLQSAIIARVDWESYQEKLCHERLEEKYLEFRSHFDERNPHTSRLFEIEQLLDWVRKMEYQKVVEFETDMYGNDAFMDCLIEPQDYIFGVEDVKCFIAMLIQQFQMHTLHPDDVLERFPYTESPVPGQTFISEADARWLFQVMACCYDTCDARSVDLYDIIHTIQTNHLQIIKNQQS